MKAALDGAKYILMERFAEDASLLERLRAFLKEHATLSARLVPGKEEARAPSSATTSNTTNRSRACPRTAPWRSSAAATKAC